MIFLLHRVIYFQHIQGIACRIKGINYSANHLDPLKIHFCFVTVFANLDFARNKAYHLKAYTSVHVNISYKCNVLFEMIKSWVYIYICIYILSPFFWKMTDFATTQHIPESAKKGWSLVDRVSTTHLIETVFAALYPLIHTA